MTASPVERQKYTVDDLLAMPDDGKNYELTKGEIVEVGTSNQKHSTLGVWLVFKLMTHLMTARIGGRAGGADATYILDPENVKVPDVSYLTAESVANILPGHTFCPFGPDFAIEIKSTRDSTKYMQWLAELYIRTRTRLVWVIDPIDETVTVYQPGQTAVIFTSGTLDASAVLPGFKIDLADMFAQIENI